MGARDLISNISPAYTITPQTRTTDLNGTGIDLQGFSKVGVYLMPGIGGITFDGTNKIEFILEHSDDNSAFTAVEQADVSGGTVTTGIFRSLVAAHAAATITEIGYIGAKRYIRVVANFSGTHGTGTPMAALVLRGQPNYAPVA
jgi:hypothetical protein